MVKLGLAAAANILSIGGNLILMTLKLVIGFIFGSISLIADGFDSVLDLVSATIAGIGERVSRKPADSDHPFGHHKFQTISSLAIVTTMLLSSYFIADDAISKLVVGISYDLDILILVAAIISFVGKILLFLGLMVIGKKLNSPVFIANAKNYRTDAVSSVFVGLACNNPLTTCFCTSVGGAPFSKEGFDIQLFEMKDKYAFESITDKGEKVLKLLKKTSPASDADLKEIEDLSFSNLFASIQ